MKNPKGKAPRKGKAGLAGSSETVVRARRGSGAVGEFYARAMAIERAAAERYREFARQMASWGNVRTAELFLRLAHFEAQHAERLSESIAGMGLSSRSRGRLSRAEALASEVPNYEFLYRRVLPQHALLMALASERRAKAFFERERANSADPEIRKLAAEFAQEEAEHIAWLEEALEKEPQPPHPLDELAD